MPTNSARSRVRIGAGIAIWRGQAAVKEYLATLDDTAWGRQRRCPELRLHVRNRVIVMVPKSLNCTLSLTVRPLLPVNFTWSEKNGPPVDVPAKRSFGTR